MVDEYQRLDMNRRNAIRCTYCGHILESTYTHDFRTHTCEKMQEDLGPDAMIGVDGGPSYLRRIFSHEKAYEEVYE